MVNLTNEEHQRLCEQAKRAEAAEARAAMLQEALGPNARILNQRRDDQIKQLEAERDELRAKLEQAQRQIEELETTLKDIVTAPYENQPNDGDEWEKEYYLRGMHRP